MRLAMALCSCGIAQYGESGTSARSRPDSYAKAEQALRVADLPACRIAKPTIVKTARRSHVRLQATLRSPCADASAINA